MRATRRPARRAPWLLRAALLAAAVWAVSVPIDGAAAETQIGRGGIVVHTDRDPCLPGQPCWCPDVCIGPISPGKLVSARREVASATGYSDVLICNEIVCEVHDFRASGTELYDAYCVYQDLTNECDDGIHSLDDSYPSIRRDHFFMHSDDDFLWYGSTLTHYRFGDPTYSELTAYSEMSEYTVRDEYSNPGCLTGSGATWCGESIPEYENHIDTVPPGPCVYAYGVSAPGYPIGASAFSVFTGAATYFFPPIIDNGVCR
jgi:hypothetical protein